MRIPCDFGLRWMPQDPFDIKLAFVVQAMVWWLSEWLSLTAFWGTADSGFHIVRNGLMTSGNKSLPVPEPMLKLPWHNIASPRCNELLHSSLGTVWCCYSVAKFLPNPHNRHLIACPKGWAMGVFCEFKLWLQVSFSHCSTVCDIA